MEPLGTRQLLNNACSLPRPQRGTPGEPLALGSFPPASLSLFPGTASTWPGRCPLPGLKSPFQGQSWVPGLHEWKKMSKFPSVSLPDEYYSTTCNICKSSSWQLKKMQENKLLFKLRKDIKHSFSGTGLGF